MTKKNNLAGERFGRWTVVKESPKRDSGGHVYWWCECDCRTVKEVIGVTLRTGASRSCGCLADELKNKHNETGTRLYKAWQGMKQRCYNPKDEGFKNYGERGIEVCAEWLNSYESFRDWANNNGYSDDLTIDRVNNDGNYSPENCRWTDWRTQNNNTRTTRHLTLNGKTLSVSQWARHLNVKRAMLNARLRAGWTVEETLLTPTGGKRGVHGG